MNLTDYLVKEIQKYYNKPLNNLNSDEWKEISGKNKKWKNRLTEEFIDTFADKLDWNCLSCYQIMSESLLEKYLNRLNWQGISSHQRLSEDFIKRHKDKVFWIYISQFQKLSFGFLTEYKDYINLNFLLMSSAVPPNYILSIAARFPELIIPLVKIPSGIYRLEKCIHDNINGLEEVLNYISIFNTLFTLQRHTSYKQSGKKMEQIFSEQNILKYLIKKKKESRQILKAVAFNILFETMPAFEKFYNFKTNKLNILNQLKTS